MKTTAKDIDRINAINRLREELKPGDTIYTVLRHVSQSGMSRSISLLQAKAPNDIRDWSGLAARAMGYPVDEKRGAIKIRGAGMHMGFALVYDLCATLWPKGTPKPRGTRNGEQDSTGGYVLHHRWI